jgi:AdoMet-dependent heme synthase
LPCRANSRRSAGELTFEEAQTLIQGIKAFGAP